MCGSSSPKTGPFAAPKCTWILTSRRIASTTPVMLKTPSAPSGPADPEMVAAPLSELVTKSGAESSMSSRNTLMRTVSPSVIVTIAPRAFVLPHVPGRFPIANPRSSTSGASITTAPVTARAKRMGTMIWRLFRTLTRTAIVSASGSACEPRSCLRTYNSVRQQPLVCLEVQNRTFEHKALIAVYAIAIGAGVTDLVTQHAESFLLAADRVYGGESAGIYRDFIFCNNGAIVQQLESRTSTWRYAYVDFAV